MLDIFAEPDWSKERTADSIEVTLERTEEAADLKGEMLLAGVVQGSIYPDLREMCARRLSQMGVDVNPIGGVVPLMETYRFAELVDVIIASKKGLTARPAGASVRRRAPHALRLGRAAGLRHVRFRLLRQVRPGRPLHVPGGHVPLAGHEGLGVQLPGLPSATTSRRYAR